LSSTDALFTRFEGFFKKYLDSKQFLFLTLEQLGIEQASLRQLFYYSWDNGDSPSKQMLLEVLQITYPSGTNEFWGSPAALEDHVLESFALALKQLKFAEHTDTSLPQEPEQKSKPGIRADPEVQERRDIVKKYIHAYKDWFDPSIKDKLLDEFDEEDIPFPKDSESFPKSIVIWADFIKDYPADDWKRVVDKVLNKDRWR